MSLNQVVQKLERFERLELHWTFQISLVFFGVFPGASLSFLRSCVTTAHSRTISVSQHSKTTASLSDIKTLEDDSNSVLVVEGQAVRRNPSAGKISSKQCRP